MTSEAGPAEPVAIRLPRTSYLIVLFLVLGCIPVAFAGSGQSVADKVTSPDGQGTTFGPQLLVLLIPLVVAVFVVRTATFVTQDGLRVRAAFGSRDLPWSSVRGLAVRGRSIYAVQADGSVRLPCVRLAHLGPISRLSGGALPTLRDSVPKPAPSKRRR